MQNHFTGKLIKELRELKNLTQSELADLLNVSDKTVSKWETGRGLPDIAIIEPLAKALNVSVLELMKGQVSINKNKAGNVLRSGFSVCPVCGNIVYKMGECTTFCCGEELPCLTPKTEDDEHEINCEETEDEYYVTVKSGMTKADYVSFIAYVVNDRCELVKTYPEQSAETRFSKRGKGVFYAYYTADGLYKKST